MAQAIPADTQQHHSISKSKRHKKKKSKAKSNSDNSHVEDTKQHNEQDNDTVEEEHEPDSPIDEQGNHESIAETQSTSTTDAPDSVVLPLTENPREEQEAPVKGEHIAQIHAAGAEATVLPLTAEPREYRGHFADKEHAAETIAQTEEIPAEHEAPISHKAILPEEDAAPERLSNGTHSPSTIDLAEPSNAIEQPASNELSKETEERLAAAAKERDELRLEVTELRKSLESIQQQHEDRLAGLRTQVEEADSGKEHAEVQYKTLLGKVNTIRAQLGERLKADAEDLAQARTQIEELEEQNRQSQESTELLQKQNEDMQQQHEALQKQIVELGKERDETAHEVTDLRNRASTTQQNWISERDDLIRREALARDEFETARQAMQDWEVLAMEERSIREGLGDRVAELEEQLVGQQQAYERAATERDDQSNTVDGLQRALQDVQEARKQELRETVEAYQSQLEDLRKQLKIAEETSSGSQSELDSLKQNLDRALPFEKEVKEKNLLIGKLRHEAVILNDHLTKALKYIKRSKPDDTVDKQLITNHLLQFLALDRSDPKRFQILQIMSAILAWTEEQQESAGLARPGASHQPINPNLSLRLPLGPFRRVSSSASFHQPMFSASSTSLSSMQEVTSPSGKESLSELWSGFLEREAMEGSGIGGRRLSTSSAASAPGGGGPRRDMLASPGMSSPTVSRYALPKMEENETA